LAHLEKHIVGEIVGGVPGLLDVLLSNWLSQIQEKPPRPKTPGRNGEDEFGLEPHVRGCAQRLGIS